MTLQGEMSWTKGTISLIEPKVVSDIISRMSDVVLVISETGQIQTVFSNPEFAMSPHLQAWQGQMVQDLLTVESVSKFDGRLKQFLEQTHNVQPVQLNHSATDDYSEFPIKYSFHLIGSDGAILLLGSDLTSTAEIQQQLVAAHIALENDYEAQREQELRFRVLLESSDISSAFVSVRTGRVVACNSAFETLVGKSREMALDASFSNWFETKGRGDLVDQLVASASEQTIAPVPVKSLTGMRNLLINPVIFRGADGPMLLCKFSYEGEQDAPGDQLQTQLLNLYHNGVDSIVFVDESGLILSSNEAFLKFADVTHPKSITGRSMVDFFSRGTVDLNVMLQNAKRTGAMRLYATKLISEHGGERTVEISTTQLKAGQSSVFAMIIRDGRRVETVRTPMQQITEVDMRSVIELIGGHSLKDIVAKSTDVIEKMCIETAVEMTSNNRVAAAEMLGLSRQSLYVKLRKYGLVNKS